MPILKSKTSRRSTSSRGRRTIERIVSGTRMSLPRSWPIGTNTAKLFGKNSPQTNKKSQHFHWQTNKLGCSMNIQFLYFKEPPSLLELACLIWSVSNMLALIEMLNKFAPEHCQFVIMVETNRKNATKSLGGGLCVHRYSRAVFLNKTSSLAQLFANLIEHLLTFSQ